MKIIKLNSSRKINTVALVDDEDYLMLSRFMWFSRKSGAISSHLVEGKRVAFFMHRIILNTEGGLVEHIDGNKFNNQKNNIRVHSKNRMRTCLCCGIEKAGIEFRQGRNTCEACATINRKRIYSSTREEQLKKAKEYRAKNKEKVSAVFREYYVKNAFTLNEKKKIARKRNKLKIAEYSRQYSRRRKKVDSKFKLSCSLRSMISRALTKRGWCKNSSTQSIIGCDFQFAKTHFESLFACGMSWENYGKWHIDHIIPLSFATTKEQLVALCHYTNLQPLWALDNLKKGDKILFKK